MGREAEDYDAELPCRNVATRGEARKSRTCFLWKEEGEACPCLAGAAQFQRLEVRTLSWACGESDLAGFRYQLVREPFWAVSECMPEDRYPRVPGRKCSLFRHEPETPHRLKERKEFNVLTITPVSFLGIE